MQLKHQVRVVALDLAERRQIRPCCWSGGSLKKLGSDKTSKSLAPNPKTSVIYYPFFQCT